MKLIQWYPGHMEKTKRQIKERLKVIDIVFELVDARAPISTRNPMIDAITEHKPRLILLNKSDLAIPSLLDAWIEYFSSLGIKSLKINALEGINVNKIVGYAQTVLAEKRQKAVAKGLLNRPIRALIVGIPNVGKSTLINQLVSKRVTRVGDIPGITKHLQMIRIHESLELLDTPGVLWPKFDDQTVALKLALIGSIKDSILALDDVAIYGMKYLASYHLNAFNSRYDITVDIEDILSVFTGIGQRRGALKPGGKIDDDRVIDLFLHDFRNNYFGPIMLDREVPNVSV